jgi:hypothetical protein
MRTLIALFLLAVVAWADTSPGLAIRPWFGEPRNELELEIDAYLDAETGDGFDFRQTRYEFDGRSRVTDEVNLGYDFVYYDINSDDPRLPSQLVRAAAAASFPLGETGKWRFLGLAGLGTASSKPFVDGNSWYLRADLTAILQTSQRSSWIFSLYYDGNRAILPEIPFPSVVYQGALSRTLRFQAGLPFLGVQWQPDSKWEVSAQFLIVALDGEARVAYKIAPAIKLYAAYDTSTEGYFVEGSSDRERIFYRQRKAELGVEVAASKTARLRIAGGYGFQRRFWRARDITDDEEDRVDLGDAAYFRIDFNWSF